MTSQVAAAVPAPTLLREILTWGGIALSLLLAGLALLLARRAAASARAATRRARESAEEASRLGSLPAQLRAQSQTLAALGERVLALEGLLERGGDGQGYAADEDTGIEMNAVAPPPGFLAEDASASEVTEPAAPPSAAASEPSTPVDFDGRAIRVSRALSHLGDLRSGADGRWLLYLNPEVEVNHVAYAEWSKIFELRGAAYARYRTVTPATIDWNAAAGEGTMTERGVAEAIA